MPSLRRDERPVWQAKGIKRRVIFGKLSSDPSLGNLILLERRVSANAGETSTPLSPAHPYEARSSDFPIIVAVKYRAGGTR